MERFARGFVIGVAVGGTTLIMVNLNTMVLGALSAVNKEVAKALARLILAPPRDGDCDCDDCKKQ